MDISELKKQSDLSYNIAIAKRNALEKAHSRQILAYEGYLFRADPQTIGLVKALTELHDSFCVLDTNNNPVEITDPTKFLSILIKRNQESLNAYNDIYKTFTKKVT
jgi:hypothetical protein|tara:strand:+ start:680 stop:997 length:318 start_codon:yes stop_codon:yes gene_type:complete